MLLTRLAMRVAVPVCRGRVSPVFDESQRLLLVDLEAGRLVSRIEHALSGNRGREIRALGVDVLICGAVSRTLEAGLLAQGINVIAQVCGPVDEVVAAFAAGNLEEDRYVVPGCRGRHRRRWAREYQRKGAIGDSLREQQ